MQEQQIFVPERAGEMYLHYCENGRADYGFSIGSDGQSIKRIVRLTDNLPQTIVLPPMGESNNVYQIIDGQYNLSGTKSLPKMTFVVTSGATLRIEMDIFNEDSEIELILPPGMDLFLIREADTDALGRKVFEHWLLVGESWVGAFVEAENKYIDKYKYKRCDVFERDNGYGYGPKHPKFVVNRDFVFDSETSMVLKKEHYNEMHPQEEAKD